MQLIPNWVCFMQMRHMYICWISGFYIWPTTSPDRFIMNWTEFQSAFKGCHSINPVYDNLLSVCECVCESVLAVCAVSVVFEQCIHAAKIRGHPWHFTPINQTSAEFFTISLFLFLPPTRSLPLTGSLHMVKFISPGDAWETNKRDEVGRKEKNKTVTLVRKMGKWSNALAAVCMCVCLCQTCVRVR